MKKFLIILIILFICGILSADICLKQMKESTVLVGREFYEQYANAKIAFGDVFLNIFYQRMKLLGILFLLGYTPVKGRLGKILLILFSFIWGFFLMSCIVGLGVAGLVVGLICVLPHGLLYGAVITAMLGREKERIYSVKRRVLRSISSYIIILLLFVTACIVESLIGTHVIPWMIRLSFV